MMFSLIYHLYEEHSHGGGMRMLQPAKALRIISETAYDIVTVSLYFYSGP